MEEVDTENARVIKIVKEKIKCLPPITIEQLSENIWVENSFVIIDGICAVKNIPRGNTWRWNQTNIAKVVEFENFKLRICKLHPRKRDKQLLSPIPRIKLWFCCINLQHANKQYHILWCEKGLKEEKSIQLYSPLKRQTQIPMDIKDFSFLAPFMDLQLAEEIWPNLTFGEYIKPQNLIDILSKEEL